MIEQSPVNRRTLLAASSAVAIGAVTRLVEAGPEKSELPDVGEREHSPGGMTIKVQLATGEFVTYQVAEMITSFKGDVLFTPNDKRDEFRFAQAEESWELKLTLTDGKTLKLNATGFVIDYGVNGQLHVQPHGIDRVIEKKQLPKSYLYDGRSGRKKP